MTKNSIFRFSDIRPVFSFSHTYTVDDGIHYTVLTTKFQNWFLDGKKIENLGKNG